MVETSKAILKPTGIHKHKPIQNIVKSLQTGRALKCKLAGNKGING